MTSISFRHWNVSFLSVITEKGWSLSSSMSVHRLCAGRSSYNMAHVYLCPRGWGRRRQRCCRSSITLWRWLSFVQVGLYVLSYCAISALDCYWRFWLLRLVALRLELSLFRIFWECIVWWVYPGRFGVATASGEYYWYANSVGYACGECFVHTSFYLFCGDYSLWTSFLC